MRGLFLDLLAIAGFGTFLVGVHQVYPPAALIVGGALACLPAAVALLARSAK